MKKLLMSLLLLLCLTSTNLLASGLEESKSTFDVSVRVIVDGKPVANPRLIAYANQAAAIDISNTAVSETLNMSLIADDALMANMKDAIKIKLAMQYRMNGEYLNFKPELILKPNQEGMIKFSSKAGHSCEVYVLAKRKA